MPSSVAVGAGLAGPAALALADATADAGADAAVSLGAAAATVAEAATTWNSGCGGSCFGFRHAHKRRTVAGTITARFTGSRIAREGIVRT
jgi:hypothetical protein